MVGGGGHDILGVDGLHNLGVEPQLLVESLNPRSPFHVCLDGFGRAVFLNWHWHGAFMVFHLHQRLVHSLNVTKRLFTICDRGSSVSWELVVGFRSLEVEQWSWRLGIAECNLSKTALDDELFGFWPCFGSLDRPLNLLLHALHVVVASAAMSTGAKPVVRLEEIGLRKLACWLLGVVAWSAPDLAEDLVVKVLCNGSFRAPLFQVSSRRHQLLQLDTSDEVLVLRRHETIVLCQESNLVISLRPLCVFFKKSSTLGLGQLKELLRMGNDHSRKRRASVMGSSWLTAMRARLHRLALAGEAVGVLQDLAGLCR